MSTKRFEKGLGRGEGVCGVHHDYLKSLEQGNIPQARYDGLEMMRLVDLRGMNITRNSAPSFVPRVSVGVSEVEAVVSGLLAEVKREGSAALIRQAKDFDGVTDVQLSVSEKDIRAAAKKLDRATKNALLESIRRVRAASEDSLPAASRTEYHTGGSVATRYVPVDRAGVYIPGGKAVYPSSVVMNVVAAQAAGVKDIVLVSPGQDQCEGQIHPSILAAADLLGVTEVYAMGGAGAIAALAYGVAEIGLEPVDVITGPGNQYVAEAKRQVKGIVGIDSEAGPTEIGIIADDTAHPEFVAADLLSQAEHDELASVVLITTSHELASRVEHALTRRLSATKHHERAGVALMGEQSGVILVDSLEHLYLMANAYAPEHLSVMIENPEDVLPHIRHAGAIFIGPYTPVSAGDYAAGSNHVLPTDGSARFSSGLSPQSFLRSQQVIDYDKAALAQIRDAVVTLANAEDLPAHGEAIEARFSDTTEQPTEA